MTHSPRQTLTADVIAKLLFESVWETVRWIAGAGVVGGSAFVGVKNIAAWYAPLASQQGALALIAASFGVWGFVTWMKSHNRLVPIFDRIKADYHIIEKEFAFIYKDATHMQAERRWILRARRKGLSYFTDNYRWSGSAPVTLKSGKEEHEITMGLRKGFYQYYNVNFQHPLKKGEIVEICVIMNLEDAAKIHVPCLNTRINEPTDTLILKLQFPEHLRIHGIVGVTLPGQGAMNAEPMEAIEVINGKAKWKPHSPARLLHYYELRWNLPELMS
jgi:hypothetical protein